MRLHLGSGPWYSEGWVNADLAPYPPFHLPDVWADATHLPFRSGVFAQIYLGHFLEHLPWDGVLPAVLVELRRVVAPDGQLAIVGPCYERALATSQPSWLLDAIRVHGSGPGGHAWTPTTALTRQALEGAGLDVTEVPIGEIHKPEWCNPNHEAPWQCAFTARWRS